MKTIFVKPADVEHKWYLVDAEGKVLGRLASRVVAILRGKNKPEYAPHWDMGDSVVIINADKIRVTGRKPAQKMYYRHSRYPGGFRAEPSRSCSPASRRGRWSAPSRACSPRAPSAARSSRA